MTDLSPYISLTPSGLLGIVVVMILMGYLVPLRIVRGRLADKDMVIDHLTRVNDVLQRNNAQLLRGNDAAVQVFDALPGAVGSDNAEVV